MSLFVGILIPLLTSVVTPLLVVPLMVGICDENWTIPSAYRYVFGVIWYLLRHGRLPDDF